MEAIDFPGAVIGGGCIRDYLLGLEPKDIDVFVPIPTRDELEELCDRLNDSSAWQLGLIEQGCEEEYDEAFKGILIGVLEGEFCNLPVNIISRRPHLGCGYDEDDEAPVFFDGPDLTSLIASFDYGILQIAYANGTFESTPAHAEDLANRTATLTRNDFYDQSLTRFARFNKRNPFVLRLVDPWQEELPF